MTQQRTRLAQVGAAAGGALLAAAPMLETLARRRRRRDDREDDDRDDDDDSRGHTLRDLVARRRRQNERDDREDRDDDDDDRHTLRSSRHNAAAADDDGDDDEGGLDGPTVSSRQGLDLDLNIDRLVQERIDTVLGGDGDNEDEPNIVVGRDGDALTVLTRGIAFAEDSQGIAVETGGISYDSGAAADFES